MIGDGGSPGRKSSARSRSSARIAHCEPGALTARLPLPTDLNLILAGNSPFLYLSICTQHGIHCIGEFNSRRLVNFSESSSNTATSLPSSGLGSEGGGEAH